MLLKNYFSNAQFYIKYHSLELFPSLFGFPQCLTLSADGVDEAEGLEKPKELPFL